jgi:hypothetical protein
MFLIVNIDFLCNNKMNGLYHRPKERCFTPIRNKSKMFKLFFKHTTAQSVLSNGNKYKNNVFIVKAAAVSRQLYLINVALNLWQNADGLFHFQDGDGHLLVLNPNTVLEII